MKNLKALIALALVGAEFAVFAASGDSSVAAAGVLPFGFHSVAVDTYGDGITPVVDGECYALVWIADGRAFGGFKCDGTLVDPENSDVVYLRALARGGKCPPVDFIVSGDYQKAHPHGTYRVVLLDTRLGDGTLAGANEDGAPARVNGWGWAKGRLEMKDIGTASPLGASVGTAALPPPNCRRPQITKFEFDSDGNAVLEFKCSERYLSYRATRGGTPAAVGETRGANVVDGAGDDETPVRIVISKEELKGDAGFFGVGAMDWTTEK